MTRRHISIAALCLAGLLSACGGDPLRTITEAPSATSRIRFFNFGVNSPGVNFYAGETKLTAIVSTSGTESTTGLAYGGIAAGGDYMSIAPGQYAVTGRIAATTDKDLPISTVNTTIADGKYYSYYQSGFYNSTSKTIDAFVVEDPFTEPTDFSVASVRFVNAISNANPMTLYAKNTTSGVEVAVGSETAYKGAGAFVSLPVGSYDLSTRYTGVATNAITRPAVSFLGGHVYTITARGDITVAPSTTCGSNNKTCLDNTPNR
ncbi:MAG TPA: DUF4397 domain-containing protein [Gemmatimonadaceae bacterium]|jgi:hypothetical protein